MAPYVKRFFQIDGNSPKKNPSKSPQSSPSPEIRPFGKFDRVANEAVERRRMARLPPPQENFTGESSIKSSQPSSMKTPSRSVKKSSGQVSKRSLKSPEISKFGKHQYPRAANNFSEKRRYELATRRPLPKPETNASDDEELLPWQTTSDRVPLKHSPPQVPSAMSATPKKSSNQSGGRGRRLFHSADDNENSIDTTTPSLGRVRHSPPLTSRANLASTAPMEPSERHVPLQHSPNLTLIRSSRSHLASTAPMENTRRNVRVVHSPQKRFTSIPKSPSNKGR